MKSLFWVLLVIASADMQACARAGFSARAAFKDNGTSPSSPDAGFNSILSSPDARFNSVFGDAQATSDLATVDQSVWSGPIPPGNRISWQNNSWYFFGANLPWRRWLKDFGGGSTNDGISSPAANTEIGAKFAGANTGGMNIVRWFMFNDDAPQIQRDASNIPVAISGAVFDDLDNALRLAEENNVFLILVLFSEMNQLPSDWYTSNVHRQALTNVIAPLMARHANHPRLVAWELFDNFSHTTSVAPIADIQETVRKLADVVHHHSQAYATVTAEQRDSLGQLVGLHLDYYQVLEQGGAQCISCTTYADLRASYQLDAPLVVAAFYTPDDSTQTSQMLQDYFDGGMAGALAWSLSPEVTFDGTTITTTAMRSFWENTPAAGPR